MTNSFFRREVLDARRDAWIGQVQISQPLPVRIVAWSCVVLTLGTALLLELGSYTRRVHAIGQVIPQNGLLMLSAVQPGTISSIHAYEGLHVRKGDVLFTEDLEATSLKGPTQKQVLVELSRQRIILKNQKILREKSSPIERQDLLNQIRFLAIQRDQSRAHLDNEKDIVSIVRNSLFNMVYARKNHLITETQFQSQLSTYAQIISSHAQNLQSHTNIESKISELSSRIARFDDDKSHDLNELDRQLSIINQQIAENEGRRSAIVLAPEDGILTGVLAYIGEQVSDRTFLVTLIPKEKSMQIDLYVNSKSIAFLEEGEDVLLRYDAFPYQKFGLYHGKILEITHAPIANNENLHDQGELVNATPKNIYRIRVAPDHTYVETYGRQRPLEAGMTVSADIATDRRRLWKWLLDPIISVRNTVNLTSFGP